MYFKILDNLKCFCFQNYQKINVNSGNESKIVFQVQNLNRNLRNMRQVLKIGREENRQTQTTFVCYMFSRTHYNLNNSHVWTD